MKNESPFPAKRETSLKVEEGMGLMAFLMAKMPQKSRTNIKSLLKYKQVSVDGQAVSQFDYPLKSGQIVTIGGNRIPQEKSFLQYTIVYEDQDIIVIEKQAGILTVATENEKQMTVYRLLSSHVKKQNPANKIFIVHRLDRETSGLMIFAKSQAVKDYLQETWTDTVFERTYVAVVEGQTEDEGGEITSYLYEDKSFKMHSSNDPGKGQLAITHYSLLKKGKQYTLLDINLETGRKNQIRVHMKEIGHPVAGDKKYGASASPINRLALHARKISFIHPTSGKKMIFESNIPKSFLKLF
jgi:23S rRNA pseudouridine1911/1915/1917 synthase